MVVSRKMMSLIKAQEGWTRKMFEAAIQMKKTYGAENVYDFSLGNPDVEPPPDVQQKLLEIVAHPVRRDAQVYAQPRLRGRERADSRLSEGEDKVTLHIASRVYDCWLCGRVEHRFEEHA